MKTTFLVQLLVALGAPWMLTQCGLLGSAAGLLTAPLRMAGGVLADGGAKTALGPGEESRQHRADEIGRRGEYPGRLPRQSPGHDERVAAR
jgi:hypothetical protein